MRAESLRIASAIALSLTFGFALSLPAQAQIRALGKDKQFGDQFYSDPYEPPQGLDFGVLEAGIATEPSTSASDPGLDLHRSPERQLTKTTAILRRAIPVGTSAADARALLQKARAHCGKPSNIRLVCDYREAATPYRGQYWEIVSWRVWINLADGRVSNIAVADDWKGH